MVYLAGQAKRSSPVALHSNAWPPGRGWHPARAARPYSGSLSKRSSLKARFPPKT